MCLNVLMGLHSCSHSFEGTSEKCQQRPTVRPTSSHLLQLLRSGLNDHALNISKHLQKAHSPVTTIEKLIAFTLTRFLHILFEALFIHNPNTTMNRISTFSCRKFFVSQEEEVERINQYEQKYNKSPQAAAAGKEKYCRSPSKPTKKLQILKHSHLFPSGADAIS